MPKDCGSKNIRALRMFYGALFFSIFLVVGAIYFFSGRKENRAPGLRHAMALIALIIVIAIFLMYRASFGS